MDVRDRLDRQGDGRLQFTEIRVGSGVVRTGDDCEISLAYNATSGSGNVRLALAVYGALVEPLFHCSTDVTGDAITELATNGAFTCTIPRLPLAPGHYTLSVFCEIDGKIADWVQHAAVLEVAEGDFFGSGHLPSEAHGTFYVDHRWSSEPATVTSLRLRQSAL